MIEVDQFAKSIKLSFACPRCGKHIGCWINDIPQPNMHAENYTDSVNTELRCVDCFSCKKETFNISLHAGIGDKGFTITNPNSPYPIDETEVEIEETRYI